MLPKSSFKMACASASASSSSRSKVLSKPLDFQKLTKHGLQNGLQPPSIYANQTIPKSSTSMKTPLKTSTSMKTPLKSSTSSMKTLSKSPASMKTPSDFALKPCAEGDTREKPEERLQNPEAESSPFEKAGKSDTHQNKSETFLKSEPANITSCSNTKDDVRVRDETLHHGTSVVHHESPEYILSQEIESDITRGRGECSEGSSKAGYKELEGMYIESKNKLDKLEKEFSKISKTYDEKKITDSDSDLAKQLENIRLQNQLLSGKLQTLEQCQFSDVKVVVDKYLTRNQYESEKDALVSKISMLERAASGSEEEKGKLLRDIELKDERYEKAMIRNKEERYAYEECIDKLNVRISEMIDENERIRDEKEDLVAKNESSVKTIAEKNEIIGTKNACIDDLNMKINEEMNKNTELCNKLERQSEGFEAALSNVERMLKEEVAINTNLDGQLRVQDVHVKELELNVSKLNGVVQEAQYSNDIIKSLKKNLESQSEENIQLHHLCRTLQSTNESLNIHITSLNEIMRMQEPYTGFMNDEQNAKMLQMWREKVYSLLVLLKMQEMKTKTAATNEDGDGESSSSVL